MFDRIAESFLKQWLTKKRRKPLILRGARQVGKSTLVRRFAARQGLELCEVNLERHRFLDAVFKTLDVPSIIKELEGITQKRIPAPNTLVFLDEIQATPHGIQALRYFYEDRAELPVIAAGSLLEFTLSNHSFPMPVGRVEYYHLAPMSFKEFLNALEPALLHHLTEYKVCETMSLATHQRLVQKQREYLCVGGMPEAVLAYFESGSLVDTSEIHRSIADTYQDDFSKYARNKDLVLLQQVFRAIPRLLGKKIKYANINREHKAATVRTMIELLSNARVCHQVFHSHCSGVPLDADIKTTTYKLIFMDIGMVNHICGNDWSTLSSLDDTKLVNEGPLAEQFIGQQLIRSGKKAPRLTYWLRESRSSNAEVDYVASYGDWIVPIEVKAGKSGSLKSLQQFMLQKKSPCAVRFDLNPPSLQQVSHTTRQQTTNKTVDFQLLSLPLYLAEETPRLINQIRTETTEQAPQPGSS